MRQITIPTDQIAKEVARRLAASSTLKAHLEFYVRELINKRLNRQVGELVEEFRQPLGYSISAWCEAMDISRSFYYTLRREGLAPKETKLGKKTIISAQASRDWLEMVDRLSEEGRSLTDIVAAKM